MRKFVKKAIAYINIKFVSKYIDNRYWKLIDQPQSKKIALIENTVFSNSLSDYYPALDMERLKNTDPVSYHFITLIFSRYLYKISDAVIDPKYGWVIIDRKTVFKYSWPLIEDPWDAIKARPSVINFFLNKKTVLIEKGIWIKFSWSNYYHFFLDTLTQIYLCDQSGIPADVPIIVPANYMDKQFVRDYLNKLPLKRPVIVQEKGKYLRIKELFIVKDHLLSDSIKDIVKDIRVAHNDYADKAYKTPSLIFISRNRKYGRTLRNLEEIELAAKNNGFEIIEPGNYTWEQQQYLFSNTKCIVGVHGAGLTNIMFCKNPDVRIMELFPGKGLAPEHYGNISKCMNFHYESIQGDGLDGNNEFFISKDVFVTCLDNMLKGI